METVIHFFQAPRQNFFLFGPRGTGKSTWLKQHYVGAETIDLLAPKEFRAYSARPERLRQVVGGAKKISENLDKSITLPIKYCLSKNGTALPSPLVLNSQIHRPSFDIPQL